MKRKPSMNSIGAALQSFGGAEVPSAEELRQLILNCATAANGGDVDDYRVAQIIEGLLESYLAACAMEDDDDEEELPTLGFEEAERVFLSAYAKAYGEGVGQPVDRVETCGWPDFLPERGRYSKELAVDLGRLVGFLDVQRCKAMRRYFEEEQVAKQASAG